MRVKPLLATAVCRTVSSALFKCVCTQLDPVWAVWQPQYHGITRSSAMNNGNLAAGSVVTLTPYIPDVLPVAG